MRRRLGDEQGASLVLVIIFVVVFSVVIGAILQFSGTGLRATTAIADVRDEQHAIDGAMDGAINAIRGSSKGLTNNDCASPADDFVYSDPEVGTITVTCDGVGGSVGGNLDNMPEYAILTLGTDPSEGFIKSGNELLTVDGGVFSNSRIAVTQNEMKVLGDAYALLGCPPESGGQPTRLFASGERDCHRTTAETDPNYAPAVAGTSALVAVDPPATCSNGNNSSSVVKFTPGLYTRLPKYHVPSGCTGDVWWFSVPTGSNLGVYYFDFPDAESLWDLHANPQVSIVGGTPNGWNVSTAASAIAFPGACAQGTETAPNPGVQFILGGRTRLAQQTANEAIELCSWGGPTGQRIALYGLRPSDGSRTSVPTAQRQAATASATNFVGPDLAKAPGGGSAVAALDSNLIKTASLTLSGFADVPAGSRIDSATLEITHKEGGTHPAKAALAWKWKPQAGADIPCPITNGTASHTDVCDILPALNAASFPHVAFNGLQSSTLDVDAASLTTGPAETCLRPNGTPRPNCTPSAGVVETATVEVDSIVLKVAYTPPGFEAHRCATVATPPSCAILETKTNPTVFFHGTFYAPTALVTAEIHNKGDTVFERGIIARMIEGNISASSKQVDAPFQLPGSVDNRKVVFTAFLGGKARLRAKVTYDDSGALYGRKVTIDDWAVLR